MYIYIYMQIYLYLYIYYLAAQSRKQLVEDVEVGLARLLHGQPRLLEEVRRDVCSLRCKEGSVCVHLVLYIFIHNYTCVSG